TAFHQNTNGQLERANKVIAEILRSYIDPNQKDWAGWLWRVESAINNAPVDWLVDPISPNQLHNGSGHEMPRDMSEIPETNSPAANAWMDHLVAMNLVPQDALIQ